MRCPVWRGVGQISYFSRSSGLNHTHTCTCTHTHTPTDSPGAPSAGAPGSSPLSPCIVLPDPPPGVHRVPNVRPTLELRVLGHQKVATKEVLFLQMVSITLSLLPLIYLLLLFLVFLFLSQRREITPFFHTSRNFEMRLGVFAKLDTLRFQGNVYTTFELLLHFVVLLLSQVTPGTSRPPTI